MYLPPWGDITQSSASRNTFSRIHEGNSSRTASKNSFELSDMRDEAVIRQAEWPSMKGQAENIIGPQDIKKTTTVAFTIS